jgi:hypothetical protein
MTLVEINPIILKCSQVSGLLFDEWFNNGISWLNQIRRRWFFFQ